ncbi:hypothetical protein J4439_07825 [Candidatus Woesearchaeota archaeon]|nr:hypothetical protein [Candidatus Woesearchaeota archaeon]
MDLNQYLCTYIVEKGYAGKGGAPAGLAELIDLLSDVPLEWAVLPDEQDRVPKTYVWNDADNAACSPELDDLRFSFDYMRLSATEPAEFNILLGEALTEWQAGNLSYERGASVRIEWLGQGHERHKLPRPELSELFRPLTDDAHTVRSVDPDYLALFYERDGNGYFIEFFFVEPFL